MKQDAKKAAHTPPATSDVSGNGYGSSHDWQDIGTSSSRTTMYRCRACACRFAHHYPTMPDIFEALAEYNAPEKSWHVPDVCAALASASPSDPLERAIANRGEMR